MKKLIEAILIPQHPTEVYKKSFFVYDKIIQAGTFILVLVQIISSYYQHNTKTSVLGLYIFLVSMSVFLFATLVRYYCCCLRNDLQEKSYKEENNKYCILILNPICENIRNVSISFVIFMFGEKIYFVNTILSIVLFVFASIPTLINIKNKWIAFSIVALILLLNSCILFTFLRNLIMILIAVFAFVVCFIIQKIFIKKYKN